MYYNYSFTIKFYICLLFLPIEMYLTLPKTSLLCSSSIFSTCMLFYSILFLYSIFTKILQTCTFLTCFVIFVAFSFTILLSKIVHVSHFSYTSLLISPFYDLFSNMFFSNLLLFFQVLL